jgi:hypothetical protein
MMLVVVLVGTAKRETAKRVTRAKERIMCVFSFFVSFEITYFSRLNISLRFSSRAKSVFDIWNG